MPDYPFSLLDYIIDVPGYKPDLLLQQQLQYVHIVGLNPDIDTGYWATTPLTTTPVSAAGLEDIIPMGGAYYFSGGNWGGATVTSTSVQDDALTGAGARELSLIYLDSSYRIHTLTVALAGLTGVALGTADIMRINSVFVVDGGPAVGTVRITENTYNSVVAEIPVGMTTSPCAIYTVPHGYRFYLTDLWFSVSGTSTARMTLQARCMPGRSGLFITDDNQAPGTFIDQMVIECGSGTNHYHFSIPLLYGQYVDMRARCYGVSAHNTSISVVMQGYLDFEALTATPVS